MKLILFALLLFSFETNDVNYDEAERKANELMDWFTSKNIVAQIAFEKRVYNKLRDSTTISIVKFKNYKNGKR
jgi:hypothetical protein